MLIQRSTEGRIKRKDWNARKNDEASRKWCPPLRIRKSLGRQGRRDEMRGRRRKGGFWRKEIPDVGVKKTSSVRPTMWNVILTLNYTWTTLFTIYMAIYTRSHMLYIYPWLHIYIRNVYTYICWQACENGFWLLAVFHLDNLPWSWRYWLLLHRVSIKTPLTLLVPFPCSYPAPFVSQIERKLSARSQLRTESSFSPLSLSSCPSLFRSCFCPHDRYCNVFLPTRICPEAFLLCALLFFIDTREGEGPLYTFAIFNFAPTFPQPC